jgi:acetoin utilization protein AcuC
VISTALVWDESLAAYSFGADHPLNPRRLELTLSLIHALGLIDDRVAVLKPRAATDAELERVHAAEYIAAVRCLSKPGADPRAGLRFGLGTEDVPLVVGLHDAATLVAGATLVAAEAVMSGRVRRAFSPAGGLHHAKRAEAAGFCVYSDLALAIDYLKVEHGARVMYIDYDAHHGDGVQQLFYDDPDVLTVSFHESGTFLFPGTGFIDELGSGDGYGYSVNLPLEPHTEDESLGGCFDALVPALADAFRPDVIVLQNGCDAHAVDPLTHLRCTTGLFERMVKTVGEIADRHCQGRIVATGGGGYAIYTVVPRAWSLVWAGLRGLEAPDSIPDEWLRATRIESGSELPCTLRDPPGAFTPATDREAIAETNLQTMRLIKERVLPILSRRGLAF